MPFPMPVPVPFNMGMPMLGGPISTAGNVLFIAATADNYLRAYNMSNGEKLWQGRLPAGGQATPMTYEVNGKQYVVISAGATARLVRRWATISWLTRYQTTRSKTVYFVAETAWNPHAVFLFQRLSNVSFTPLFSPAAETITSSKRK